ncbi:MAG: hypothetical protein FJW26_05020 [Acidimicrobiia bacterium]|nr:hypothetical protein [Acidimicrobiia bacterium]
MCDAKAQDRVKRMLDELEVKIVVDEQRKVRERIMKAATWQEVDHPPGRGASSLGVARLRALPGS